MRVFTAAACLYLGSCGAPDRWNAGVSRGNGEIDGSGYHDYDTEETRVEVGVSGPLGGSPVTRREIVCPLPHLDPACPTAPPAQPDDGIPWDTLLLILSGYVGGKGCEVGYRKVRSRKTP